MSVTHACGNTGLEVCVGLDREAPGGSQLVICAVS